MRNVWAGEFDASHRSLACGDGEDDACPHVSGFGGGFNPRRLRPEFGAALCTCACHASCPITGSRRAVPVSSWREGCRCPGAAARRQAHAEAGFEARDFSEIFEEKRRHSQARREAYQAARAAARGQSREQIRDACIAELRSRGLGVPADDVIEVAVESIRGNYLPATRALAARLGRLGSSVGEIAKVIRDAQDSDHEEPC
jgi:hypothetical protein